jgi:hypothetical protein
MMRLSPSANQRFIGFQPNAMKFPNNPSYLSSIEHIESEIAKICSPVLPMWSASTGACGVKLIGSKMLMIEEPSWQSAGNRQWWAGR